MNVLSRDKQVAVLTMLGEGGTIRGAERVTGAHRDTIMRLLVRAGTGCKALHDARVQSLQPKRMQVDEVHTFCHTRQLNLNGNGNHGGEWGEQFVFVGMDADTKLVVSYLVAKREGAAALRLMYDLRVRCWSHFQLTTDGFPPYVDAVRAVFGRSGVDYAQLVKVPAGRRSAGPAWYEPPPYLVVAIPTPIYGKPNPAFVSTAYVERQNLTLRHQMRRLTRLTPAFSKKLANLEAAVAFHYARYNFVLRSRTLGTTPAVAAGITEQPWPMERLVSDALALAPLSPNVNGHTARGAN